MSFDNISLYLKYIAKSIQFYRRQVQILMEYDRNYNENMPLVQVRDIIKYMTQLTFMTRQSEQPPAKRTRTS